MRRSSSTPPTGIVSDTDCESVVTSLVTESSVRPGCSTVTEDSGFHSPAKLSVR